MMENNQKDSSFSMAITKENLDRLYAEFFDMKQFIAKDPCGTVYELLKHTNSQLDIELGALFVCVISWGSRKVIVPTAMRMLRDEMGWHPADFILSGRFESSYANAKNGCVYRTLNVETFKKMCRKVRDAIRGYDTLESYFDGVPTKQVIATLCEWLSDAKLGTMDKSACKRVCMYVRWMTRAGQPDFNIWRSRSQSDLYAVMDVHVCELTQPILTNKRPTWKACEELTNIFRSWDPVDPLKYDVALMTLADL